MLGKPTASNPFGGMKQKYHDFADKLWNKFKVVRREIASSTSVIWARLLPNNLLPSGKLMPDIVHQLRLEMFAKWQVEPTSKGSKLVYSPIEMVGAYAKWCPTWFPTWRMMGPAAGGRCSQIFMSECCGFQQVSAEDTQPLPASLINHFSDQASNVNGVSRAAAAKQRQLEESKIKEDRSTAASLIEVSKRAVQENQVKSRALFLELEMSKERRQQRADEIERLKYMITRAIDPESKKALEKELDGIYATPISPLPSSCSSLTSVESSPRSAATSSAMFSPLQPKCLHTCPDETVSIAPKHQALLPEPKPTSVEVPSAALLQEQQAIAQSEYNGALYVERLSAHRLTYRRLIEEIFFIDRVTDNCLFACIASALDMDGAVFDDGVPFDSENVRLVVAHHILKEKGDIFNHRTKKYEGPVSSKKFEKHVR